MYIMRSKQAQKRNMFQVSVLASACKELNVVIAILTARKRWTY